MKKDEQSPKRKATIFKENLKKKETKKTTTSKVG
jgi:hypothetical protein